MMMGGMRMGHGPIYRPPQQLIEQTKEIQQEKKAQEDENKLEEQTNVKEVTQNMVEVLSNSADPKHRNSKFLKFLLKLNHGAYELKDQKLVKHPEKISEFRQVYTEMRDKMQKAEVQQAAEE